MARQKGSANFSGTIEPLAGGALDARDIVQTKADLTASGSFPYSYIGMETYVVAENKKYRLVGADPTVLANWEEIGSGGSGGNINDETPTFTEAGTRANIASGEKISVIMGKIQKFFTDLKSVAFSGSYSDLSNKPTIPDELADLSDDSTHRLVTDLEKSAWNAKQNALTAGSNINISNNTISAIDTKYTAGTGINIENNVISATGGGGTSYTAGDGIVISNDEISVDEMASADMAEIVTPLPSVQARFPILFDEMSEERVVGWYRYSNGTKKKVYEKHFVDTMPTPSSDGTQASKEISIGASVDVVVVCNGISNDSSMCIPVPMYREANRWWYVMVWNNNASTKNKLVLRNYYSSLGGKSVNITIQYTKTTDTAI